MELMSRRVAVVFATLVACAGLAGCRKVMGAWCGPIGPAPVAEAAVLVHDMEKAAAEELVEAEEEEEEEAAAAAVAWSYRPAAAAPQLVDTAEGWAQIGGGPGTTLLSGRVAATELKLRRMAGASETVVVVCKMMEGLFGPIGPAHLETAAPVDDGEEAEDLETAAPVEEEGVLFRECR